MNLRINCGSSVILRPSARVLVWLVAAVTSLVHTVAYRSPAGVAYADVLSHDDFDVVIAGGSTAAFAAAVAAAKSGARTALLEPTDWVGGQLTSSGVPAVDEAWHKIKDAETGKQLLNVSQWARDPRNMTPNFLSSLQTMSDCGDCWVSRFCFRPRLYLETQLLPMQRDVENNLVVFLETVVKRVQLDASGSRLVSLTAVKRSVKDGRGYDRLPSEDLHDWYSESDSSHFNKRVITFGSDRRNPPVFVDATDWGEVLALSGAEYLQGTEDVEGLPGGDDRCGQSIVYCLIQKLHEKSVEQPEEFPDVQGLGLGDYQEKDNAWQLIWTYRRVRGEGPPAAGDLCLQNWGYSPQQGQGGNDYPFGYLFKSREATAEEADDWRGGVNLAVLAGAEQRAIGWHHWFRQHAPPPLLPEQFSLAGDELGTGHGLAKLPYIRDTRRSIGLDRFILKFDDLTGPASDRTGTKFADRVALGAYPADIHPLSNCKMPKHYSGKHDTLPFHIPFRALTHYQLDNLLVAGKTMAQSFLANSATRLHPIEWSTGTAAGVAAAFMAESSKSAREAYQDIGQLQSLIRQQTPIDWTAPD
ncbi:MAG: FAD-dependent oxidoreductase [Planctomycetota bacterium]